MPTTSGSEAPARGRFAALKNLLATLLATGKTRAELLVVEVQEEQMRFLSICTKAAAAAFMLVLGLILGVAFLAVVFWEERVLVFGLAAAFFLLGGGVLAVLARQQLSRPGHLFRGSLAELQADIDALRRHE